MDIARAHSAKIVLVSYRDGAYWEEWLLRFNRGNKLHKPVKFFAERTWQSDYSVNVCAFSATHFDYASERDAESDFAETVASVEGKLTESSLLLKKELALKFDYKPSAKFKKL